MKRWQKIVFALTLLLTLWLWSYTQLELCCWLSIPVAVAALLALYAAYDILGSIAHIKGYPEESESLVQEIKDAKQYYKSINKTYYEK